MSSPMGRGAAPEDQHVASSMEEDSGSDNESPTDSIPAENLPPLGEDDMTMQTDGKDTDEEEGEDTDDEDGDDSKRSEAMVTGRGITLAMLMSDGCIKPGAGVLSIEYLGKRFVADLLEDGSIREGDEVYSSPSAWAIRCKKIVNPAKKSGCGWASVKYNGRKLDVYKCNWFRKQQSQRLSESNSASPAHSTDGPELREFETEARPQSKLIESKKEDAKISEVDSESTVQDGPLNLCMSMTGTTKKPQVRRKPVKYGTVGRRSSEQDQCTQVECTPFAAIGRIQPFTISVASNSLLLMDFHCHLTTNEVVGYLGGKWDPNTQHMSILQAYPCCCQIESASNVSQVEAEIRQSMESDGLSLVGWYHSHPYSFTAPSLRDIDLQMENQLKLRGLANTYLPCIGLILSPYNAENPKASTETQAYWVMPPPENKPQDYGIPMQMSVDLSRDYYITQDLLSQVKQLMEYYRKSTDLICFKDIWRNDTTYLEKLKTSLMKSSPKDQSNGPFLEYIHNLLMNG